MSRIEALEKEIEASKAVTEKLQKELDIEKRKNEIAYLIQKTKNYYGLTSDGCIYSSYWDNSHFERNLYAQGNVFLTQEEAEKELNRRILLTRFKQFRDKCNGDWKPDRDNVLQDKFHISYSYKLRRLDVFSECRTTKFSLFGYFKNQADCFRAISLLGDEIKRLFLEEE